MRYFAFAVCSGLLFASNLLVCATPSEARNDENAVDTYSKRKQATAVWFGPRLGRKKRNPGEDGLKNFGTENEQLGHLLDAIQETPWAVVAIGDGKRHLSGFTPRLGRDSSEELISLPNSIVNERYGQDQENNPDLMMQRSPPFAPRLGRRQVPFSPRLGRLADRLLV